jgi:hypothetical protein
MLNGVLPQNIDITALLWGERGTWATINASAELSFLRPANSSLIARRLEL